MQDLVEGMVVSWNPKDIGKVLAEKTARLFQGNLPINGMMRRIDGAIGIFVCQISGGKRTAIPVLMSEIEPAVI